MKNKLSSALFLLMVAGLTLSSASNLFGASPKRPDTSAIVLYPITGTIILYTDPIDVRVYLDGKSKGVTGGTQFVLTVPPGRHKLKFSKVNYQEVLMTGVIIRAGEPAWLGMIRLTPLPRRVVFITEPAGAGLSLKDGNNRALQGASASTAANTTTAFNNVPVGDYNLTITKPGYQSIIDRRISVNIGENKTFRNTLLPTAPAVGSIHVESNPSGAKVYLDNTLQGGVTPLTINSVAVGSRNLRLEMAGYRTYTSTVTVTASQTTTHSAILTQALGSIDVRSDPAGAQVYLDGSSKGATPRFTSAAVGRHSLFLRKSAYAPYEAVITVADGQTTTHSAILTPAVGSISVNSTPPGAQVYLDNILRSGVTPLTIRDVAAGDHTLYLKKDGYQTTISETIRVTTGQTVSRSITLIASPVSITVNFSPAGSHVALDGVPKGVIYPTTTSVTIPGVTIDKSHLLQVYSLAGYEGYSEYIRVTATGPNVYSIILTPSPIIIDSFPKGAQVSWNGVIQNGVTPLNISNVADGEYTLKLTKTGYQTYEGPVQVTPDRASTANPIYITLVPEPVSRTIDSSPSGAQVFLDGVLQNGVTPVTLNIAVGYRRLKLTMCGFRDHDENFQQMEGSNSNKLVSLTPLTTGTGLLWVGSVPPGATVSLSGKGMNNLTEMGKSPLFIDGMKIGGKYEVKVERRGFLAKTQDYEQCQKNGAFWVNLVKAASR